MAFRRRFRRGFRRKRVTHWATGNQFHFGEVFAMSPRFDAAANLLGFSHIVQITGDVDLFEGGGEGMLLKRIVGYLRPIIALDVPEGEDILPLDGAKVVTSFQQVMVPEGTVQATVPTTLAQYMLNPLGLGSENVLFTRVHEQPGYRPGSGISVGVELWHSLMSQFSTNNTSIGQVFYQPANGLYQSSQDWNFDITSVRKIEENYHVFMVTDVEPLQTGPGPFAGGYVPTIRYTGALRELIQKAG